MNASQAIAENVAVQDLARAEYFEWLRTDILACVPESAKRVLSVGCGAGVTEHELVKRGIDVVGIELDPASARLARQHGLTVLEGDASEIEEVLSDCRFDCLIYADVLEHIVDPVSLLRAHVKLLDGGGSVIISVPNFRHFSVFAQLFARGLVRYTDAGILDRTHVRLTTRRMVQEWFAEIQLQCVTVKYRMPQRREKITAACSLGLLREFVSRQIIVVGTKN